MNITWYGHACFKIESNGYSAVIDPFTGVPGYDELKLTANAVYASHGHFDHNYFEAVTVTETDEKGFDVSTVPSFHDDKGGKLRGSNLIHIFEAEGLKIVHLGDLGHLLNDAQISAVSGCDVLMIPVGGFYTIDAETAVKVLKQVQPRVIIPMHFFSDGKGLTQIGDVKDFLKLCEEPISFYPSGMIEIDKDTPSQVAVLK